MEHRINDEIRAREVRLVGENITPGVYTFEEALKMSSGMELDLVEISPQRDDTPPICRIMDYNKFVFDQKKKQKEMKANTVKNIIKEIRFGPTTDDHDLNFKVKHAKSFLEDGFKVKAYVHFKGRTIIHTEIGLELLKRFLAELEEYGKVEAPPKLEGKRMIVFLNPKGKKSK